MKLKNYSAGMKARLGFATGLEIEPDILLVDEILAVGDISFKKKSFEAFLKFKDANKTIFYTTHNINILSELYDQIILLNNGKLEMIGEPDKTIQKYKEIMSTKSH